MRLLLALLLAAPAWAHGGLPISQGVMRQGETMFIPVVYWGLWVGDGIGPWTWICEEEINPYRNRKYTLSTDGTFYVSDSRGVTLSTDQGCTWKPAAGELAALRTSDVTADPVDGATAWVTTSDVQSSSQGDGGSVANNALFVTHDHGASFSRVAALDGNGRRFESVKLAPGTIYVVSAALSAPFDVTLHRSGDGGVNWQAQLINFNVGGAAPYAGEVMAIDPRDPGGVWLRLFVTAPVDGGSLPLQILVRSSDGGATVSEVHRLVGEMTPSGATRGIDGVAVDGNRGRVFVATAKGLLAGDDPGGAATVTLSPTGGLTIAQCVEVHGDILYVCSSNYAPDLKALARSDDGGKTFTQVLSYQATKGPVDCPKGTPVGDRCPGFWNMYADQLGINTGIDAGPDAGGGGGGSCSCSLGEQAAPSLLWMAGLGVAGSYLLIYRRRRRA